MTIKKAKVPVEEKKDEKFDSSGSFASYLEYNKILRTWFVAFGIGGPALFLVNKEISERLVKVGELKLVALLFLGGAASQILGALLNKYANWYVYSASEDKNKGHWKYKLAEWVIEQFWIDVFLDLFTIACYGVAIWQILTAFAPNG